MRLSFEVLFAVLRQSVFVYLVRIYHQQISEVKLKGSKVGRETQKKRERNDNMNL